MPLARPRERLCQDFEQGSPFKALPLHRKSSGQRPGFSSSNSIKQIKIFLSGYISEKINCHGFSIGWGIHWSNGVVPSHGFRDGLLWGLADSYENSVRF